MKLRFDHEWWRGVATVMLSWWCGYMAHAIPVSAALMLVAGIVLLWGDD